MSRSLSQIISHVLLVLLALGALPADQTWELSDNLGVSAPSAHVAGSATTPEGDAPPTPAIHERVDPSVHLPPRAASVLASFAGPTCPQREILGFAPKRPPPAVQQYS